MRRYWTGTTEQSAPRAAPSVWPMPYHASLDVVDREDAINAKRVAAMQAGKARRR